MEVEEQAVKHKPFLGPIPNAQQRAEALEYIKRCSDNNYSDYNEDELVKSVNFIAKASAKSHGEDKEALQALTPLLTTDKITSTQIVHAAFYVLAISALHGNDVPLSTVRAAEAKLDDDPTLYDFCKRAREYCRVRTNKNRGMTNFIDLSEALRKHIGAGDTAAFCEKFAALCDAPAIEGDAVPLFERLLRLCALQQNAEFLNPQLAQKAIFHVFSSNLCEDMAILGSAMYFAAKTETQELVDIDKVAKVCKTQLMDMKKKPTKGLFEGIFLFVSSPKFSKEEPKHRTFANDMFQLFVSVLDRIVLYEDVTKTFTEVHRCGETISFDVPFKSLINIQERPFISNNGAGNVLDDDAIDTAVMTRLLAVATFVKQLYPSMPLVFKLLLDTGVTKKILTTFCAGIPMLRKQKSVIAVVNAFSTAFRLVYAIVQPVKTGFREAFKETIVAEFSKELTDKDAWDELTPASLVQGKRHVVNSLCMIFCAFLAHWGDWNEGLPEDMTAYLQGLLLLSFYCDSTESALFIRTILRANNLKMADMKAVYAAMFNHIMGYIYNESSDNGVTARFSGALSTMDAEKVNTLFDDEMGDVLIALFNSTLESYSVKQEDKGNNDDDDDNDAMELSDSEKENTDAKAVNISNLVFSCRSLTNKFKAFVVDTVKVGPEKLFALPRSVCAHIMKSFVKEADDYLAQQKRKDEEEKQKQAKGDTNEAKDVPKDLEVPEGVFVMLSEMGMDRYQVQVAANRLGNTKPEEIASYYFENSEKVNAMADERRIMDMKKREEEEAEARRKAEEAKSKDVEMRDDDEEMFEFPKHVVAVFELMKLFPALSARYPANKDIISNTAIKVAAEYGAYNKDNIFTMLRYLTTKFDPELKQPFTMKLLVDLTRTVAMRKTKVDVADDGGEETAIVQTTFDKITALFAQKLEALAKEGEGKGGEGVAFHVEDFAEWFGNFVDIVSMPLNYFDYESADVLIADFRDNIYSLTPITRVLPEESIAGACVTVINTIARHWPAFTSKSDGDDNLLLLEGVLRGLATCINAVRNTPGITRAGIAPLITILANSCEEGRRSSNNSNSDSNIRPLSQGCVRQMCRVFAAFASHTADDVIRMIYRICEAFAQFEGRTDVFNACFDPHYQFEDVRAFVIAGGVALDIGKNGEGFILRRNCGQADFLASSTVTALVEASRARRTAILDALAGLCAVGNGVAQTVGAYLWMALPTMTGDRHLSQYVARLVCGKCADLVGPNESLVLKNNVKEFFTAITESETQIDFKNFVEFVLQKIVKQIRHKAQREAFMSAFMEFNEATEILGSLAKLQHPTAWLFLRVIVNMHLKKAESVLRLISDAEDISKSADSDDDEADEKKDKREIDYSQISMNELANMSEEEQIELITMLSARKNPSPPLAPSSAKNTRMKKPDYWPELEERVLFMKSGFKTPENMALEAVQERFNEEEPIDPHFAAAAAPTAKDLQVPKRATSEFIEIKYAMITVKMLYTAIANDVFVGDLATAGASKGKDDEETAARHAAYEAEVAAVKANIKSFIEALPPSMKQEVIQSMEEELKNLRRKYNITDDGDGGGKGPRNGYDAVYAKVMQISRGSGSRCYANNSTDAFQNSQLPAESEVPILTPVEVENYVGLVLECGRRDAEALDGILLPCILLLGLCKPTRDALYGKLVAVFAECAQKNGRVAYAVASKVLKEILLPKNSKVYGADAILLNAGRVRTLIEVIAPFTADTENVSAVREMYELLKRLTEKMVPRQQLGGGLPGGNSSIECVEVSEGALECIVNCKGVKPSDVEEVILRLAGNKANMGVLLDGIRGKLVALVKEEIGELDKTADLILKKEIDGSSDLKDRKLFERSGELEAQLKIFCRITSLSMRGVNPNRNKPSSYLGDYVIHCNFDDLGLDDLCDSVGRVLESIEKVCPELAPDRKSGSDDDDAIVVDAPPQKVPANGADADPFHRISDILSRQEALIVQHKREIDEIISQYQEQQGGPQTPPQQNANLQPQPVPAPQVNEPSPPSPPQPQPPRLNNQILPQFVPPPQQPSINLQPHLIPPPQPFIPIPLPPQQLPQQQQPNIQIPPPPPPPQLNVEMSPQFTPLPPQQHEFLQNNQPFILSPMGPMFGNNEGFPLPPPNNSNSLPFSLFREQRQQEGERRRESRLNDIRQRLSVTQDVEEASMLLEALIDTYQTTQQSVPFSIPPRERTEISTTLSVLNFIEAIVVSMKFVVGFTGDRNELFREVIRYYEHYLDKFMRLLRRAQHCASSKCSSIVNEQEVLALELREAVTERAEALGVMNRARFMRMGDDYDDDDDGDGIMVRRKPFTNVVIALANLLDIVYITETSRSRLEYEKRHENEAEESNLLCMSVSSGSLSGEGGDAQSLFKEHEKLFSLILSGDLWLIGGALKGLVVNVPSLVSFEDKVRWFQNELDKKRRSLRSGGSLRITVNRMNLFEDSFRQMMGPIEDLRGRLRVDFRDEGGTDAGGLMREWFNEIAVEIANQQYGLFKPSDDSAIQPNPKALFANEGAIEYFKFVGRIVGKTIWDRQLLDVHFTRSFYKQILGRNVNAKDMESVDRTIYESLRCIYDNHVTEDDYIFFSETVNQFGETEDVPLIPGGESIPVTDENKAAFINLKVQFLLVDSIKDFLAAFMRGFNEFIDQDLIAPFTENQLELLISGMPTIDIGDMRRHTVYNNGYNENSEQIVWFWEVVGGFNEEEKAMLLQFITGSSKVPTGGFANLRIKITMIGKTSKLPLAHTCFNELELPRYETFEELKKKLTTAVVYGCVGFGFS